MLLAVVIGRFRQGAQGACAPPPLFTALVCKVYRDGCPPSRQGRWACQQELNVTNDRKPNLPHKNNVNSPFLNTFRGQFINDQGCGSILFVGVVKNFARTSCAPSFNKFWICHWLLFRSCYILEKEWKSIASTSVLVFPCGHRGQLASDNQGFTLIGLPKQVFLLIRINHHMVRDFWRHTYNVREQCTCPGKKTTNKLFNYFWWLFTKFFILHNAFHSERCTVESLYSRHPWDSWKCPD